jgi:hypothetical protein
MAVRTTEFEFEGQKFTVASMTLSQAEAFIEESKKLIEASPDTKTWISFMVRTAAQCVKGITEESARADMDLPTLRALYQKILEFSVLRTGEVVAV